MTPKQQRFVQEYIIDLNATQAAIRTGYSKKTAYSQGQSLLKKIEIKAAVDEALEERAERTQITADDVVRDIAISARANIIDYVEIKEVLVEVGKTTTGRIKKKKQMTVVIKSTDEIDREKLKAISSIKQGAHGIEIRLTDKIKAQELLGRHLGMFTDNMNIKGTVTKKSTKMSEEEKIKLIEKLAKRKGIV